MSDIVRCMRCGNVYTLCSCSRLDLYSEIRRLRKVVDAACQYSDAYQPATDEELLRIRAFLFQEVDALRELDGDDE